MPLSHEIAAKTDAPAARPGDHNTAAEDAKKRLAQEAADERAKAEKAAAEKAAAEKAAAEKAKAEKEKAEREKAEKEKTEKDKPGTTKGEPAAKTDDSTIWSSVAASVKKAGALAWEAASDYLPSFGLFHSAQEQKTEIKKDESLDINKLVSDSCSGNSCTVPAAMPDSTKLVDSLKVKHSKLDGFGLALDGSPKDLKFQTDHASILNTNQLNDTRLAELEGLQVQKEKVLSDVQKLGNADVHRDAAGKIDAYRTADGTKVFVNEQGTTEVKADGSIIRKDKNGHVFFEMAKDGSYKGDTATGQAEVDATTGAITLRDKQGNIIAVQHKDRLRPSTIHTNGSTIEINVEDMNVSDAKGIQSFIDRAKQEGKPVQFTFKNAVVNAAPDGTAIGVLNDGTSFMAIDSKHILVRKADGTFELHGPEGPAQKLSAHQLREKLKEQGLNEVQIATLRCEMRLYASQKILHHGDNHSEIRLDGKTITAVSGDTVVRNTEGLISTTDQTTQISTTYDPKTNTTTVNDGQGHTSHARIDETGKADVDGLGWQARDNKVVFANNDTINADRSISMANGTTYHADGHTTFRDGSSFNADGTITSSTGVKSPGVASNGNRTETAAEAQKEAQAVSMAAYAQSVASSLRGLAASGHASASDLAALESAYSSICSAVAALDDACDPATRVQLMITQDSVGSALDVATDQVSRKEEAVKIVDNMKDQNPQAQGNMLAALQYTAMAA